MNVYREVFKKINNKINNMAKKTYYEFLSVKPKATSLEIKIAAQHLVKKFSHIKYSGNPRVVAHLKKIKLVYNILANPKKRAAYDAALAKKIAHIQLAKNSVPTAKKQFKKNSLPSSKNVQNIAKKQIIAKKNTLKTEKRKHLTTHYDFFGITIEATTEEIKITAQHLANKFQPAKYPGNPRVIAHFNKIKFVYNILANPKKRAAYDAILAKKMLNTQSAQNSVQPTKKLFKQNVPPTSQKSKTEKITEKVQASADKDSLNMGKGEKILYRGDIHWIGYLRGFLLISIPVYLLLFNKPLLTEVLDHILFLQDKREEVDIGLLIVLGWGILMLPFTFFQQFTTTLTITSQRIIAKLGLFSKKQVGMELAQFEHIENQQGIFGTIFGFGTLKIRGKRGGSGKGVGGIKIHVSDVASPKQFEKRLMRIIKQSSYHQI
jgi:curved DNA-binding protein CbpA